MKGIMMLPEHVKMTAEKRKWQTRRLGGLKEINATPDKWTFEGWYPSDLKEYWKCDAVFKRKGNGADIKGVKPCYRTKEVVYIKEGIHRFNVEYASYDRDFTPVMFFQSANRLHWRWKKDKLPAMFLPEDAARTFTKTLDVRCERLSSITAKDCIAEGLRRISMGTGVVSSDGDLRQAYFQLWNSINPKCLAATRPWVFVYDYELVSKP